MDVTTWLSFLNSGGVLGLLVVIVLGGSRGWWYYGHVYDAQIKKKEAWKQLALTGLASIKEVVDVIEPIVERLGRV